MFVQHLSQAADDTAHATFQEHPQAIRDEGLGSGAPLRMKHMCRDPQPFEHMRDVQYADGRKTARSPQSDRSPSISATTVFFPSGFRARTSSLSSPNNVTRPLHSSPSRI